MTTRKRKTRTKPAKAPRSKSRTERTRKRYDAAPMMDSLLAVLGAIAEQKGGEFTTRDIERGAGLSYSSTYNWLKALEHAGWVEGHLDMKAHVSRGTYRWRSLHRLEILEPVHHTRVVGS